MAPTAASTGEITAPTNPMVNGKTTTVLPPLSLIVIFLTLPSLISALNFPNSLSPFIVNVSFLLFVAMKSPIKYILHYVLIRVRSGSFCCWISNQFKLNNSDNHLSIDFYPRDNPYTPPTMFLQNFFPYRTTETHLHST